MAATNQETRQAIVQTLIIVLGSTVGIWLAYFLIAIFFKGINEEIAWPGFYSFVEDGSFLLMSFSFLTTILIATSIQLRANFYNISALVLLLITAVTYARFIGLGGKKPIENLADAWLLWTPFVASIVLLFFSLKNQKTIFRSLSWLNGAKTNSKYSVFLSFAIAGAKTSAQRKQIEEDIQGIESTLTELGYDPIFNAANHFSGGQEYQRPEEAAKDDFNAIENCDNFLLFYPQKLVTSALIELGYALRDRDNIIICTKNINTLPFLARKLDSINKNVKVIEFNDTKHLIQLLKTHHAAWFI